MTRSPSIAARAVLALGLMVGFYLFALGIAALLLAVPFLEHELIGHVTGKLSIAAVMGAGAIVWALLPRRDRFEEPGPRLEPAEHPRLYEALSDLSRATGQAMPVEMYLVAQLNAWVAQRGGVMGFGSRRVMGVGLPLLQALSVSQLRAVLSHEFGHYYGGDTRLGPWLYTTRAAIERTLAQLDRQGSVLVKPFKWYGQAFLRITHAVKRRQEFTADALAARTVGAQAQIAALRITHGASDAFTRYWEDELVPAFQRGLQPPVALGFEHYLASPQTAQAMDEAVQTALANDTSDPYDTHPSLAERIAALEGLPAGELPEVDPPAITLLNDVPALEQRLIAFLAPQGAAPLEPARWEEVGRRVWLPFWRENAERYAEKLRGFTAADLPPYAADLSPLAVRFGFSSSEGGATGDECRGAVWVLGMSLCVVLADRGWEIRAIPGEDVVLQRGEMRVQPFTLMRDIHTGALPSEEWLALCDRAAISGLDLGRAVAQTEDVAAAPAPATRAWTFVAMEFYGMVLNRVYRVIVTDRKICGARVRGTMSSPFFEPSESWQDPDFYPSPELEQRYANIDVESSEFLATDKANFQYDRTVLAGVEFSDRPKWGMGNIPHSGRIVLRLQDGSRRELILLGRQPGSAIRDSLAGESTTAAAA
jgi:heat shock protein HtpX